MVKAHRQSGFTIYELMLTVGIAGIILAVAVPNLRDYGRNNRITAAANDLVVAVTQARSHAIKSRVPTTMCFSASPDAAVPACDGNGRQGWIVYSDADGNGAPSTDETLLRHSALHASLNIRTKPDTNNGYVAFSANGFPRVISGATALTGVVLCDSRGNEALYGNDSTARGIQILPMGRARVTRDKATINSGALGGCP